MPVLVAADFTPAEWAVWWPLLVEAMPGEQLLRDRDAATATAIDVAIVANPLPGSLAGLPRLELVQSLWAGVDRLLLDGSVPGDVLLARMVDPAMSTAMAQTALWATLGLHRGFFACAAQQQRREWRQQAFRRADELTVAVLGFGQMGRATTGALLGAGYRVVTWRRNGSANDALAPSHAIAASLADALRQAHVTINLLPSTPETRGLFDISTLASMREGASLVNLARGAHVVDADLLEALDRGHLQHAVLDVFAVEPLPPEHPYWKHPRVTVLPHVAAPTDPRSAARIAAANVRALRENRPIAHVVDRHRGY